MKLNVLALAIATSAMSTFAANAQTVIEERQDPAVVIEHDHPASVTIEKRREPAVKTITKETTGSGDCSSKTVHKEDETGSKTVHKTNCD